MSKGYWSNLANKPIDSPTNISETKGEVTLTETSTQYKATTPQKYDFMRRALSNKWMNYSLDDDDDDNYQVTFIFSIIYKWIGSGILVDLGGGGGGHQDD